ncbi:MAG: Stk1 family PASTA domain-containing Ser/Thr kinase, partial [Defluviitaleaceae bacterium]|nr:Stk1 family PASTA domain-containing Ser/Thr kinase [Defluviitaleaceae bacterium]
MRLNPGTVLSERYEITGKIGSGGMAVVYRAKDLKLDRYVTVKVMREEYMSDDEFIKRFNVEARAAASLSSQNIVNVYDVGQEDNVHYIVMEYVDGVTLKDLILKRAPFDNEEILGVAIQIATGIAHAHDHQVIHRDIKPQNIMVTSQGIVKVTDFGIARAPNIATTTTSSGMMGSVHYFSPEQARGVFVDEKSDLYSLGITMYEMATGRLPFDGESAVGIALKQINDPLPPIRDFCPGISPRVEQIILKATEKSPARRYQSAEDMLDDLKSALSYVTGDFSGKNGNITDKDIEFIKREAKNLYHDDREIGGEDDDWEEDDYDDEIEEFGGATARKRGKKRPEMSVGERKMERNIVIAAICTAVAIIAIIIGVGLYLYNKNIPAQQQILAPNYVGQTLDAAQADAAPRGITIVPDYADSDTVQSGYIISQVEQPNADITANPSVHVTVSQGAGQKEVPDVRNKTQADAETIIQGAGFAISEDTAFSDTVVQGCVISQTPSGGTMADPGSVVSVIYSDGPRMINIQVPDVEGKTEAEAISLLRAAGLQIGLSSSAYSDTVPQGCIISQTISPGTSAAPGSEISYIISKGPDPD